MDKDGFNPGLPSIVVVIEQDTNPLKKRHSGLTVDDAGMPHQDHG